jgi:hypothetical protein
VTLLLLLGGARIATGPGPLATVRGAGVLAAAGSPVLSGYAASGAPAATAPTATPQATVRTDRPR